MGAVGVSQWVGGTMTLGRVVLPWRSRARAPPTHCGCGARVLGGCGWGLWLPRVGVGMGWTHGATATRGWSELLFRTPSQQRGHHLPGFPPSLLPPPALPVRCHPSPTRLDRETLTPPPWRGDLERTWLWQHLKASPASAAPTSNAVLAAAAAAAVQSSDTKRRRRGLGNGQRQVKRGQSVVRRREPRPPHPRADRTAAG